MRKWVEVLAHHQTEVDFGPLTVGRDIGSGRTNGVTIGEEKTGQ